MRSNFEVVMKPLMAHEGGYSNRSLSADPGGATYKGVTWRTYNNWRAKHGLPTQDVRRMTDSEKLAIYREGYWDVIAGDSLPSGVDYCVFDGAVNSGPSQAIKWLQRGLKSQGVYEGLIDGFCGPGTITSAGIADPVKLINSICDQRLAFMRTLKNFNDNPGWVTRVREVRKVSLQLLANRPLPIVSTLKAEETGKAYPTEVKVTETPEGSAATKEITIGSGGLIAFLMSKFDLVTDNLGAITSLDPKIIRFLIEGVLVVGVLALVGYGIYSLVNVLRRQRNGESTEAQ